MEPFTIVGLGEILWDVFPTHKQLGGAPANFAYISNLLGDSGVAASRVGEDALGDEVIARLRTLGLDTSHIQRDPQHATGTVNVELASDGQPRFEITPSVAWDFVEWSKELSELAGKADAVCFGSLAQRGLKSRATIHSFLDATREEAVRVFDVNLRQAFYSAEVLASSVEKANILKLNHEEISTVMRAFGGPELAEKQSAQWLCRRFQLKLVCVTRGSRGSLLVSGGKFHEHPGYPVKVVDTVGAGDAFTATLVHHFLRGSELSVINDAANRVGSWVAGNSGGTPAADVHLLSQARARNERSAGT